jgi:hypothetical protein
MGVPEEEARYYETEFQAGRAIVTVRAGDRYEEAAGILHRHGGRQVMIPPADVNEAPVRTEGIERTS